MTTREEWMAGTEQTTSERARKMTQHMRRAAGSGIEIEGPRAIKGSRVWAWIVSAHGVTEFIAFDPPKDLFSDETEGRALGLQARLVGTRAVEVGGVWRHPSPKRGGMWEVYKINLSLATAELSNGKKRISIKLTKAPPPANLEMPKGWERA